MKWLLLFVICQPVLWAHAAALPQAIDGRQAGAAGDGVRDDAPALQAALDRLAAGGGVLNLRAGVYALGTPLVIRGDRVTVAGEGAIVRARQGFGAGGPPLPLIRGRTYESGTREPVQVGPTISGLVLDGGGVARAAIWIARAREAVVRENRVEGVRAGGEGGIVVRSAGDGERDTSDVRVVDNVITLDQRAPGLVVRNVDGCRVSGNRVRGTGDAGAHGLDLTLSHRCTVLDNAFQAVDVGCLADETNHIHFVANAVEMARTGFRAVRRPGAGDSAHNNLFVDNRAVAVGTGYEVQGSGMVLVANYAAFLNTGPAIWVKAGGTHDAVVANNPSVATAGGIRFDASDGVVAANVPIANAASGIEVNGERVAVTGNALNHNNVGIRLGSTARQCSVTGNVINRAKDAALVLGGEDNRVHDNVDAAGELPEVGPGARYGSGEVVAREARTAVRAEFPDDRYVVTVEWTGDPGGREWIAEKTASGFVLVLAAAPAQPVRARWLARGF